MINETNKIRNYDFLFWRDVNQSVREECAIEAIIR
jgi:hypothetical protein